MFEVTQPRVTCYRVGIRTDEPKMPALLTSSGRPGFYFRVLNEGEVGAGDEMTVAEINALLYSSDHPRDRLERALRIRALSPGWRSSFEALLQSQATGAGGSGNAGLAPATAAHPAAPGFLPHVVAAIDRETVDIVSFSLQHPDREPLPLPLPGQYAVLRLPRADGPPLVRSYSLSGPQSTESYRISVKIEPNGAAGDYLKNLVQTGDVLEVSSPRGGFILQSRERPVVLLSAGVGATPVLAMLHALAATHSTRQVFWVHAARDGRHHPFAGEVRRLMLALPRGRSFVCYSRPAPRDRLGEDFDAPGRLSRRVFEDIGIPREADVYLCGPARFMADMDQALATFGMRPDLIRMEVFNGGASSMPGVVGAAIRAPHPPRDAAGSGPFVSFARSGIEVHWTPSAYANLLELAEACDVPVRWSCRTGVCHNCETGLISGAVVYEPLPLDKPADGNLLICCSRPVRDVIIDL
ncbi:ferredoxin-NADP reductase [Bradyrhizobium sp. LB7.2]